MPRTFPKRSLLITGEIPRMKFAQIFKNEEKCPVKVTVRRLLNELTPDGQDRREASRSPYFTTAVLSFDSNGDNRMPVYVRDISETGIGFFHSAPVDLGEVMAAFLLADDIVKLRVRICWCRRSGDCAYISGGEILEVLDE